MRGTQIYERIGRLIEPKKQIPQERKRFSNGELKTLITPIIIEQFLALLVGLADTMMISYAGEAAVSGVSLVNQLNNVFIMIFTALASGGAVVASQYIGSRDKKNGTLAASQLVMITGLISVVMMIVLLLWGRPIFGVLFGSVEQDVLEAGLTYLRISAYSFPVLAVYNACAGLFRSMGKTRTLMNVSIIMNVMNIVGNAIGIFVLHAGVAGVAYPSLISRAFAAIVMLYLATREENLITVKIRQIFTWKGEMVGRIFHIAIPSSVENGLFQISKVALSSMVAMFGTVQIAANGVAQSFWSMSALFCIAMGPAFITVIGQYMGAGDAEGAEYYMQKLLKITYLGAISWNMIFLILSPLLLRLFDLSEEASGLALIIILLHSAFNGFFCPLAFAASNGLRAAGDVKFTMYASIFSTVICRVAFSVLFGVSMGLGVIGITLAMIADWVIHAALVLFRYRSGKWKNFKVI
jgi:putative MATE family efflux protein